MTSQSCAGQPTFADVSTFVPLLRAFRRARRAKRGKGSEPAFYRDLDTNLLRLSAALQARTWRPQPYRYFELNNKKRRVVSEAACAAPAHRRARRATCTHVAPVPKVR